MKKFQKFAQRLGSDPSALPLSPDKETDLISIIKKSELTQEQVLKLFDDYKDTSTRMMPIDKRQFNQLLDKLGVTKTVSKIAYQTYCHEGGVVNIHLSDSVVHKEIMKTLFNLYDLNNDGRIDFGEFLIGTATITTKKFAKRASGVFHLYDQNRDSVISREDLLLTLRKSIKSAKRVYNSSIKHLKEDIGKERTNQVARNLECITDERGLHLMVEEIFKKVDTEQKGFITKTEFVTYAEENPETLRLFTQIADTFEGIDIKTA